MSLRLIINADDFGLTRGINRAIAELHSAGVLTSASLMAMGAAFDDAVIRAKAHPALGVGCHIVLVDGTPVSPPGEIPSLLGPDGQTFRPSLIAFVRDLHLGRIHQAEIAREALAQIRKIQLAGIRITHLDTHKHTHLFPRVAAPLLEVAALASVPALRKPYEPAFARKLSNAPLKRRTQVAFLSRYQRDFERLIQKVLTTEGTIGISATGNLDTATLRQTLNALPTDGTFELVCHPGYNDADLALNNTRLLTEREIEREALLLEVPRMLAQPHPPQLIHYGSLQVT